MPLTAKAGSAFPDQAGSLRLVWLDPFQRSSANAKGEDHNDLTCMRRVGNADCGGVHMIKLPDAVFAGQRHVNRCARPTHLLR